MFSPTASSVAPAAGENLRSTDVTRLCPNRLRRFDDRRGDEGPDCQTHGRRSDLSAMRSPGRSSNRRTSMPMTSSVAPRRKIEAFRHRVPRAKLRHHRVGRAECALKLLWVFSDAGVSEWMVTAWYGSP